MQPPLVPEVQLYLAEESLPLWEKTEEQLGEIERTATVLGIRLGRRPGAWRATFLTIRDCAAEQTGH